MLLNRAVPRSLHPGARDTRSTAAPRELAAPTAPGPARASPGVDDEPLSSSNESSDDPLCTDSPAGNAEGAPPAKRRRHADLLANGASKGRELPGAAKTAGDDPFPGFMRQGRNKRGYGSAKMAPIQNIHASGAPGSSGDELASDPAAPAFKMPDTSRSMAILDKASGFKQPPELPSNAESDKASSRGAAFKAPRKAPPKRCIDDTKPGFKKPILLKETKPKEPEKPAFKIPFMPPERRSSPPAPLKDRSAAAVNANTKRTRKSTRKVASTPKAVLPLVTFKAPRQLETLAERLESNEAYQKTLASIQGLLSAPSDSSSLSSVDSIPSSPTFSNAPPSSSITSTASTQPPLPTRCPICDERLSAAVRATIHFPRTSTQLKLSQQHRVHQAHLTASTRRVAAARRYPAPDWASLPARLQDRHSQLARSCLEPRASGATCEPSMNRPRVGLIQQFAQLDDTQAQGGGLGYYGTHGARIIAEWLQRYFASNIAGLVRDGDPRVGGAGGLPSFLQGTVVPRLVHALVEEDLRGDEDMRRAAEARLQGETGGGSRLERGDEQLAGLAGWLVQESAEVGRHLGEEENDEVARGDEDDRTNGMVEKRIVTIIEEDEGEYRHVNGNGRKKPEGGIISIDEEDDANDMMNGHGDWQG